MTKTFKTIDEQLEILKDRNLVIDDELLARQSLSFYGYYEIVNGYKQFLLNTQAETERFTDGETFSHLLSLYQLDKEFRNGIMEATLEIELVLRTAIAYVIAEQFGELQSDYLKPKNYMRGKKREGSTRYPLYQLFDKFDKIINGTSCLTKIKKRSTLIMSKALFVKDKLIWCTSKRYTLFYYLTS